MSKWQFGMSSARVQTRKQFYFVLFPIVCLSSQTMIIIIYGLKRALGVSIQ